MVDVSLFSKWVRILVCSPDSVVARKNRIIPKAMAHLQSSSYCLWKYVLVEWTLIEFDHCLVDEHVDILDMLILG